MFYDFPKIQNIEEVFPHIKNRNEFIIAEREHFTIINYVVMMSDTFPVVNGYSDKIKRECRGIAFDKNGNVISRPFHKFFNLNEREETLIQNVDFNEGHVFLSKLDGSFIRPLYIKDYDHFRWGTKMGITDVGMNAEQFISENNKYNKFAEFCFKEMNSTPIFEWISRKNKIVIDYEQDNLILLAIRNNFTGDYISFGEMFLIANKYDIPVVPVYIKYEEISSVISDVKNTKGIEGLVIRFNNGHMLKLKSDEYLIAHKSKDLIQNDRNIAEVYLNDTLDDLYAALTKEDRENVEKFVARFSDKMMRKSEFLDYIYEEVKGMSRKDFAMNYNLKSVDKSLIFSMMNGKSSVEVVKDLCKKNVGSNVNYERLVEEYLN